MISQKFFVATRSALSTIHFVSFKWKNYSVECNADELHSFLLQAMSGLDWRTTIHWCFNLKYTFHTWIIFKIIESTQSKTKSALILTTSRNHEPYFLLTWSLRTTILNGMKWRLQKLLESFAIVIWWPCVSTGSHHMTNKLKRNKTTALIQ